MAQYFEVLSQNDGNLEQTHQFFNGNQENEQTQVRYILADESPQFQTQQLILSGDQVMVLEGSQQQIVIDQGHTYQGANQQQQFGVVQHNQPTQHIFYMETSNGPNENVSQGVQAVIETPQATTPPQPIVLNHQMGSNSPHGVNRQRPVMPIRSPLRQGHVQVNQQPRPLGSPVRQGLPPQGRLQQPVQRPLTPQVPLRGRNPVRPSLLQQLQQQQNTAPRPSTQIPLQHVKNQMGPFSRQVLQKQQQMQEVPQGAQQHQATQSIQKGLAEFQQRQQQQMKNGPEDELDDHDPTMNSSPGQMVNYKKLLEQRQQIGKNPILARLSSNIKVTPTSHQPQQQQQQPCPVTQTIEQVVHQVGQQQQQAQSQPQSQPQPVAMVQQSSSNPSPINMVQTSPKKPRAPPRSKNPNATPRAQGGVSRQRVARMPVAQQPFTPRATAPQQQPPRFPHSQPTPRFANQQQMMQQQRAQMQPQPVAPPVSHQQPVAQQHQQQNCAPGQSQMNYLITPPTPNRPRQQRPLPPFIPSSQIQHIIESAPLSEEFSDSIRMLVLLENGEQRLITFTLPKEACTIQEILEQVNVPFTPETNIQVTEANTNGINYIVTVGNVCNFGSASGNEEEQQRQPQQQQQQEANELDSQQMALQTSQQMQQRAPFGQIGLGLSNSQLEPPKPPTPELPKLIPGRLAVCSYCGYTGEDFNKCRRCNRKIPDDAKSIEVPFKGDIKKSNYSKASAGTIGAAGDPNALAKLDTGSKSTSTKKKTVKAKAVENETLVIISDEEDEEKKPVKSVSEQLLNKLGASISISPVTKEPSLTEIKKHVRKLSVEPIKSFKLALTCRTVRIGSYRFVPTDDVILDSKCVIIKAPVVDNKSEIKTIRIDKGDIVKVLVCFNKALPVIFYYLNVGAAPIIRDMLNLKKEDGLFFDPVEEKEDSFRKITLLPEDLVEDQRSIINQLYGVAPYNIVDELTSKEANDILIKACPKDSSSAAIGSFSEIKQILMYPKEGQGRLSINTEDYVCLAVDQFLNDKIIDFYLKYLWENFPPEMQEKVHIFSTFFYKRLTTKPTKAAKKSHSFETDTALTAAEKRHWRVKTWTKRINIFEKDFVIVPINENAHWFLAIICFPGLRGAQTFDGKPYNPEPTPKRTKNKQPPDTKKEKPIPCDDPILSDKDEAESEDSDMESDDSEESAAATAAAAAIAAAAAAARTATPLPKGKRVPIKQPCVLIFDSLAGPSRWRVVATLRDYLTVEYKAKMDCERVFNRDLIKGSMCKVPQQNNFTDCGLYLLQYVEQFFKDPIKDFNIPIKDIENWFEEIVVTKKREDICNLLKELMTESGVDVKMLPDIVLPTLNGKVIERPETERADTETGEEEQEDMFTDIEDSEMTDPSSLNTSTRLSEENGLSKSDETVSSGENSSHASPIKPSESSVSENSEITASPVQTTAMKPTLSEFPRQTTNKDTLNYLKSKRITRHKLPFEGPEMKKVKMDD